MNFSEALAKRRWTVRLATPDDEAAIEALMKTSIREIFPRFYAPDQIEPCVRYIGHLDTMLVDDGTYFVEEDETGVIACGGWSRRYKLYAGSAAPEDDARLLDPATEPAPVRAMFVRGDRTRRGLGTRILEAVRGRLRVRRASKADADGDAAGAAALSRWGSSRSRSSTSRSRTARSSPV